MFSCLTLEIGWQAVLADFVVGKEGLFFALIKRGVECRGRCLLGDAKPMARVRAVCVQIIVLARERLSAW